MYCVQTTEGETISQLITGYVDIITQKKCPIHHDVPKSEEDAVIVKTDIQWYVYLANNSLYKCL